MQATLQHLGLRPPEAVFAESIAAGLGLARSRNGNPGGNPGTTGGAVAADALH